MSDSRRLYALIFTHCIKHPHFDDLLYAESRDTLSYKGYVKKYLIKLAYVLQSEATLKIVLIAVGVNILYERCLNF